MYCEVDLIAPIVDQIVAWTKYRGYLVGSLDDVTQPESPEVFLVAPDPSWLF